MVLQELRIMGGDQRKKRNMQTIIVTAKDAFFLCVFGGDNRLPGSYDQVVLNSTWYQYQYQLEHQYQYLVLVPVTSIWYLYLVPVPVPVRTSTWYQYQYQFEHQYQYLVVVHGTSTWYMYQYRVFLIFL